MLTMMPLLDRASSIPLYMQLYHYIRTESEHGRLPQDVRLPSIRQLARYLNVGKNTVEAAYGQLVAEGYAESRERGGFRLLRLDKDWALPEADTLSSSPAPVNDAAGRFDFRYGNIALDCFPHAKWKSCVIQALGAAMDDGQLLGYGSMQGHRALRQEIADFVYQSRGAACLPEQVYICAGTQSAVALIVQLLRADGGAPSIAMEEPGYNGVRAAMNGLGCRVESVPVEHDGVDVEALKQLDDVRAVYVTPSHQFPLGMVMPIQKRQRLLQWAANRNAFLIEDDYDSEFRYDSQPVPSLKALDRNDSVIYIGTFSKSFLPAARLAYVIMPERLVEAHRARLEDTFSATVSPLIQEAMWRFMKDGHFMRHLRKMRRIYQRRHKALTDAVSRRMGPRAVIIGDRSGVHLLLYIPGRSTAELTDLASAAGCIVYDPARHWQKPTNTVMNSVMLGFGGLTEQQLDEGVRRLAQAWFQEENDELF